MQRSKTEMMRAIASDNHIAQLMPVKIGWFYAFNMLDIGFGEIDIHHHAFGNANTQQMPYHRHAKPLAGGIIGNLVAAMTLRQGDGRHAKQGRFHCAGNRARI